jgi:phosphatidylglycerophosphatase A
MKNIKENSIKMLLDRGVTLDEIGDAVYFLQKDYQPNLKMDAILVAIDAVLSKREVGYALMTAIELDIQAERQLYTNKDLEKDIREDAGLYGMDEVLAYGICNLYGSIALTNFGFIDKHKFGVVARLNDEGKKGVHCHTFLDDMVGAIAAAAASRIAHSQ